MITAKGGGLITAVFPLKGRDLTSETVLVRTPLLLRPLTLSPPS